MIFFCLLFHIFVIKASLPSHKTLLHLCLKFSHKTLLSDCSVFLQFCFSIHNCKFWVNVSFFACCFSDYDCCCCCFYSNFRLINFLWLGLQIFLVLLLFCVYLLLSNCVFLFLFCKYHSIILTLSVGITIIVSISTLYLIKFMYMFC